MELYANKFESLTNEELKDTNGGSIALLLAITSIATSYAVKKLVDELIH